MPRRSGAKVRSSKLDIASAPPTTTTTRDHSAGLRLAAPVRFALRVLVSTDRHPRRYSADRSDDRESEKNRDRHHRWATRHQELTDRGARASADQHSGDGCADDRERAADRPARQD